MSKPSFMEKIRSGDILVADGATGTNLLNRGLFRGTPSEEWIIKNPDEVIRLHRDFIQAGADILLTNTFGGSPLRLESAELVGRAAEVNREAVRLARQAAEGAAVFVAGSIGPSGKLLKPYGPLEETDVYESFAAQIKALSEAGVDLLVIETQFDLREASIAVEAAKSVSDLPLVCSFSYDRGNRTMMGVRPAQMASEIEPLGVDMLGVNCGRSLEENLEALKELYAATDLPLWYKPNAGLPELDPDGNTIYNLTPQEMGSRVGSAIDFGAQVIGGCCGTSPSHLAQIAKSVKAIKSNSD
jgi:5-methyltetrahydrofolate--homocysteine methyltransferase